VVGLIMGKEETNNDVNHINWDAERLIFEQWFVATQTKRNYIRVASKSDGTYIDGVVRVAWRAWKKAIQRGVDFNF